MGSWGVGVFSDDLALDNRGEWRDALLRREDPVAISRRIAARFGDDGDDPDDTTGWVALAAAQHETGHPQPDVRGRALELIAAGIGLQLWEESGQLDARRAVMARLAAKLRGPQPKPKRLRGPRSIDPGVAIGDIVRIHDERRTVSVLFAVIGMSNEIAKQPRPLLLGLFIDPDGPIDAEKLATAPYLSRLDFSAFDGDEPPEHMGVAHPALTWVFTWASDRLSDVGESRSGVGGSTTAIALGAIADASRVMSPGFSPGSRGDRAGSLALAVRHPAVGLDVVPPVLGSVPQLPRRMQAVSPTISPVSPPM